MITLGSLALSPASIGIIGSSTPSGGRRHGQNPIQFKTKIKTKPFPKTRIPRWELRAEMKKSRYEDWNLRKMIKGSIYVHSEGRGPVTGWVGGHEIDFYCRKEGGRRVRLAGAAGDPFSLSLSLFKERTEKGEREQRPVKQIQIYI